MVQSQVCGSCNAVHTVLQAIGAVCFLPIYIIPCSLALAYVYVFLPETKGRNTVDIMSELKGFNKQSNIVAAA